MKKLLLLFALAITLVTAYAQELSHTRSMSDKYKKIYYTSIEDAERKLIQYQNERRSKEISDSDIIARVTFHTRCLSHLSNLMKGL